MDELDFPDDITPTGPLIYQIADGRLWSVDNARFIDALPEGATATVLSRASGPADADYLRRTLEFYGYTVGPELLTLDEVKAAKVAQIDAETSATIIAGFDYSINGTPYHFSYDAFDQQNFVDTASMCQLALAGTPGLPSSVTWNSYTAGGELVQQTFDAAAFLALYAAGAMAHKAANMAEGGARKAKVAAAQTVAEVAAI